jgi:mannan endo-1,4-beta-mannosidase
MNKYHGIIFPGGSYVNRNIMNKTTRLFIAGLMIFISSFSLYAQKFEAESATLVGGAKIVYNNEVSGGAYVSQEEGHLTWNLKLDEEAFYNIYVHAAAPSGRKINNFSVNNAQIDFTIDQSSQFSRKLVISSMKLPAGNHIVKIIKSWGWINIDYIEFEIADPADRFQINKNLVVPDPTPNTARLYQFLYDHYGKKIISGAMTLNSMDEINWLKANTGKEPALIGLDFMHCGRGYSWYNNDEPVNDAKKYYARNGIPAFCWHWRDPSRATEAFYTSGTSFDISKIFDTGSSEYKAMLNDIDYISSLLKKLYDSDVPVLWRPLHEASGGWFWWGAKGPEPCKALYRLMYDRMVNHHGLKNLIWVWTSQQNDYQWYPGDDVVDMIGRDIYKDGDHSSQILEFNKLNDDYGRKKMVTLSETGSFPDVDNLIADEAAWSYFMPWYGQFVRESKYNSLDLWKKMFAHDYVLTLDEMPDLKSYSTPDGTWRSKLYPEDWQPGFMDDRNRFLHDFSYAGYFQGEKEIPFVSDNILDVTLPPYNADNTGTEDATAAIQKALDDAGQAGGGVVYLPAGIYRVNPGSAAAALKISYSNTILRGAGTDSTFIYNDATFMRQKNIILMTGEAASWSTPVGTTVKLRADLMFPTQVIPVVSVTGFKPGDEIILRSGETSAFIEEHGMAGIWTDWATRVMFHRTIDSIDVEKKLIYIDSPTRYFMKMRDNARLYHAKQHITGCGIENLSIGNRQNDKNGWEEEDYTSQVNGAYDVHASHVINLKNAYNCWVKNIYTYKPESNSDDIHILSNGLLLDQCRGITVDSCFFQKPQYEGGGGNGYMYTLQSNDCLIKNSRANHSRHNYDFKFPHSNGNVIHNCIAENSKYSSDFHMYLSMANLFDVTTVDGDYLESTFRPWGGDVIHGYSSTQSVFYNTTGLAYHPVRDYIIESKQYRHGYIIGTSGPAYRVKLDPVGGTTGGYSYDTSPRDWSEGIGTGDQLVPHSLYLDQLQKRNSRSGLPSYELSVIVKDSVSGEPLQGVSVRNFDTEAFTDATGTAFFNNIHSLISLSLEKENYLGFSNRQLTMSRDTTLLFNLTTAEYDVRIVAVDAKTGAGFTGAMVTLGSMAGATNENGEVHFKIFGGNYNYRIDKNSYESAVGTLNINSDTTFLFPLNRTTAFIKVRLKEGESPVNNATVVLNGTYTQITASLGMVNFKDLPVGIEYSYQVSKSGYKELSGSFMLEQDTIVDLKMEPLTTSVFTTTVNGIKIWPNPVRNYLHVDLPSPFSENLRIKIIDMKGNILQEAEPKESKFMLDVNHLNAGLYIFKIIFSTQSAEKLFIKTDD